MSACRVRKVLAHLMFGMTVLTASPDAPYRSAKSGVSFDGGRTSRKSAANRPKFDGIGGCANAAT